MVPQARASALRSPPGSWRALGLGSLRGMGQVDLQSSVWTSAVILIALWVAGWEFGLFATIGAVVSTLTARFLAVPHDTLVLGLMTYCGVLGGISVFFYLGHEISSYVLAVIVAALCTVVTATLNHLLSPFGLKAFTGPFCLVSAVMLLGAPSFQRVWHGARKQPPAPSGSHVTWTDLWHGFFSNFSQIFFVQTWYVGLIMLVGLALAGWRVALFAVVGSVVGLLTAWALSGSAALIGQGIYGYNAVLTSLAFGVLLLRLTSWNFVYTVGAAAASTGLTASLTTLFTKAGSHTFTWPFNLTTWALLAAVPLLPRITRRSEESSDSAAT